mmetsp:Transcript_35083/g.26198  ORF Transcript_35083/g.26198 Transcript_35083/m.26198 type:complete len:81 (+) Transcript_35083:607-849(+)
MMGSLFAVVGAVFIAVSMMQMRSMGKKVHFLIPPFYQALANCMIAPLPMLLMVANKDQTTVYGWYEWFMMLLVTITFFVA